MSDNDYIYRDFVVFQLEDDGTYAEVDIPQEELGKYLKSDSVWLIIRQDLRRLFIWKGPTSPVRKRFISSRVAAKLQEEIHKTSGRHLKIVSIDAGDEPVEFLAAFNLEPFEVTEKLADMRYIRNVDREKLKQEELRKKLEAKKKKQQEEYYSPLLEEMKAAEAGGGATAAERPKIREVSPYSANPVSAPVVSVHRETYRPPPVKRSVNHEKVIEEIIKNPPPENMKRMNIIIGHTVYTPTIIKKVVLGKTMEDEKWTAVEDLPPGIIDMEAKILRFYIDKDSKTLKAIELFIEEGEGESKNNGSGPKETSEKASEEKKTAKKSTASKARKKRSLPKIPGA